MSTRLPGTDSRQDGGIVPGQVGVDQRRRRFVDCRLSVVGSHDAVEREELLGVLSRPTRRRARIVGLQRRLANRLDDDSLEALRHASCIGGRRWPNPHDCSCTRCQQQGSCTAWSPDSPTLTEVVLAEGGCAREALLSPVRTGLLILRRQPTTPSVQRDSTAVSERATKLPQSEPRSGSTGRSRLVACSVSRKAARLRRGREETVQKPLNFITVGDRLQPTTPPAGTAYTSVETVRNRSLLIVYWRNKADLSSTAARFATSKIFSSPALKQLCALDDSPAGELTFRSL